MGFFSSNSFISAGATSLRKRSFRRGVSLALCRATSGARCSSCAAPPFFSFLSFAITQLSALLAGNVVAALLADPKLLVTMDSMSHSDWPATWTYKLHLRDGNRTFLIGNAALRPLAGPQMLLHYSHVFNQNTSGIRKHAQNTALFALVPPAQHFHRVIAANINSFMCCRRFHSQSQFCNLVIGQFGNSKTADPTSFRF